MSPLFGRNSRSKRVDPNAPGAADLAVGSDHTGGEHHIAAQRTQLPLDDFMTRLLAQELPLLDSTSRGEVYEELRTYAGPEITSQDELPLRIREIMDL